jgi:hypothetical protein
MSSSRNDPFYYLTGVSKWAHYLGLVSPAGADRLSSRSSFAKL